MSTLNKERLIAARKKLGITKQEAAKRMNLSQPAYLRYESGERTPSIHTINVMANILGTSASYLMGLTDDSSPDSYIINLHSEPELFAIIDKYKKSNKESQERLVKYFMAINDLNNKES